MRRSLETPAPSFPCPGHLDTPRSYYPTPGGFKDVVQCPGRPVKTSSFCITLLSSYEADQIFSEQHFANVLLASVVDISGIVDLLVIRVHYRPIYTSEHLFVCF